MNFGGHKRICFLPVHKNNTKCADFYIKKRRLHTKPSFILAYIRIGVDLVAVDKHLKVKMRAC